ncbi:MAG: dTDP-glucose 4,6-dehydratase [Cellulosilyticaceae bacterium]
MKRILVTGGAGFIGSNFIQYMLDAYDYQIINLDLLTYAGNLDNLKEVENHPHYTFVQGDIRDRELLDRLFREYEIDTVINFAAESHVDRSIDDPEVFLTTNILGTQALLDIAKKYWKVAPQDRYSRAFKEGVKFVQISTDEVYGALGETGLFTEETPLAPNSPYSASKASADMMVRAYYETYGMPVNITRCSNNYGPYQHTEKLIPLTISRAMNHETIPVYGDGMQVRDWLYVEDHCTAISTVLHKGVIGEVYNIGGNNEKANIEIVKLILKTLGKNESLIQYVKDRPGHDRRYAIDSQKIYTDLGWRPVGGFKKQIKTTVGWYLNNQDWIIHISKK